MFVLSMSNLHFSSPIIFRQVNANEALQVTKYYGDLKCEENTRNPLKCRTCKDLKKDVILFMTQNIFTCETFQWLTQASTWYVILEPGDPSRLSRSINCFIFLGRLFCHLSWGQGGWLYANRSCTSAHSSSTRHLAGRHGTYLSKQERMDGLVWVHRSWQKMDNIWLGLSVDCSSLS